MTRKAKRRIKHGAKCVHRGELIGDESLAGDVIPVHICAHFGICTERVQLPIIPKTTPVQCCATCPQWQEAG